MTICYEVGDALYINLTNKCSCDCVFCIRKKGDSINPGENLWLAHEPTFGEILSEFTKQNYEKYNEIVFCGYGEPTERLEILLNCARYLKEHQDSPIRLNTNGLSDLINEKKTAPLLAEYIDRVSISLNAPDADSYNVLCLPKFGEGSFEAMLQFAKDCRDSIPSVTLTVVSSTLDEKAVEKCRALCRSLDIPLRVR